MIFEYFCRNCHRFRQYTDKKLKGKDTFCPICFAKLSVNTGLTKFEEKIVDKNIEKHKKILDELAKGD